MNNENRLSLLPYILKYFMLDLKLYFQKSVSLYLINKPQHATQLFI